MDDGARLPSISAGTSCLNSCFCPICLNVLRILVSYDIYFCVFPVINKVYMTLLFIINVCDVN